MIKRGLAVALSLTMAFTLVGCNSGGKDKSSDKGGKSAYEKCQSQYYGDVELADYSKFVAYKNELNIEDETIQSQIDSILDGYKTYEKTDETKVTDKSIVNISYVGTIVVDKKDYEFQGGTAENQDLDIANSGYISGFAEGLVGKKVGEKVTLKLKFPENYNNTTTGPNNETIELAGKDVKFKVTINSIEKKVMPDLNDDFVKENLNPMFGGNTVDEFKQYLTEQNQISSIGNTKALEEYVDQCKVTVNEKTIDSEIASGMSELETNLEAQSMSMEDYLKQYANGKSEEEFKKEAKESYETTFKTYAVICAIVEKSGKTLTEDEYNKRLSQFANQSGYTDTDSFASAYKQYYGQDVKDVLPLQFVYQDAIKILLSKATVNEGERPTEAPTTEAATQKTDETTAAK